MPNQIEILEQLYEDVQGYYLSENPRAVTVGCILDHLVYNHLEGIWSENEFFDKSHEVLHRLEMFIPGWNNLESWIQSQVTETLAMAYLV